MRSMIPLIALLTIVNAAVSLSASATTETLTNSVGQVFVRIPAGAFLMGTEDPEMARMDHLHPERADITDETPAHLVRLTRAFYIGKTEVTQGQWFDVMGSRPGPAAHWQRSDWRDLPVAGVNWGQIRQFITALSARRGEAGRVYRLPTEAEWEYVARAGSRGLRPWDVNDMDDHAWTISNSGDAPQPVATRRANPLGIHDLFGSVWELTDDWYSSTIYADPAPRINPKGPANGRVLVRRGGSYHCPAHSVRSALRTVVRPEQFFSVQGFRLVLE